jgi:hypothetical protein
MAGSLGCQSEAFHDVAVTPPPASFNEVFASVSPSFVITAFVQTSALRLRMTKSSA